MTTSFAVTDMEIATMQPTASASFGALRQIDAGALSVGYAQAGPADGPAVILLTAGPTTFTALPTSLRC
jgi:hypothetical protein